MTRTHVDDACRPVALSHSCTMKSLQSWACPRSSQTRATRYGQHAVIVGWGQGRITALSMGIWKTGGSDFQPHRPIREIWEWRWLELRRCMSQMADRWLVRGARKRVRFAARCVRRPRIAMGVELSYTCGVPGQRQRHRCSSSRER